MCDHQTGGEGRLRPVERDCDRDSLLELILRAAAAGP
jgi:hypothetical protein